MKPEDTPTPRTDKSEFAVGWMHDTRRMVVDSYKCRQLERELVETRRMMGYTRLEDKLIKTQDDNKVLLERLAERTRDYTSHAARELDKLRAAEADAEALASLLQISRQSMRCNPIVMGQLIDSITKALSAHEARVKPKDKPKSLEDALGC